MRYRMHTGTGLAALFLAALLGVALTPAWAAGEAAISGQEMLRLAETIALGLATDARLPSELEIKRTDATLAKVSAADALYLICQGIAEWQAANALPEAIPLPARPIAPSEIASAPLPGDSRVVAAADLIAQCRPLAEMMRQVGRLPAGVWAGSTRLTPAEYIGGLATMLQHYLYYQAFPAQVGIRPYLAPKEWNQGSAAPAEVQESPRTAERPAWPGPLPAVEAPEEAVTAPQAPPEPAPEPRLAVSPPGGTKLSGIAEITVLYQGPPGLIRVLVRGRIVALTNQTPFVYRWDTRLEPDGPATITVQATDATGAPLVTQQQEYELANGNTLTGG